MFSRNRRYVELFNSMPLTALSLKFLKLFVFFSLLLSAGIAHSFDVSFAWDANTEPDMAGYMVFARAAGQNYDYNNPDWEGTDTTCTLYGLTDGITYYFVARAYDIYGNESENSVELTTSDSGTTVTAADGGGGGGCFIATAAFGSLLEPHVKLLRQFRDRFLLTNAPGKVFVHLYYTYSPPIANVIAAHSGLRMIVRWSLWPLIAFSWMLLHLGVVQTLLLTILFGCAMFSCYRKMRHSDKFGSL
jgi:hypothetical protein